MLEHQKEHFKHHRGHGTGKRIIFTTIKKSWQWRPHPWYIHHQSRLHTISNHCSEETEVRHCSACYPGGKPESYTRESDRQHSKSSTANHSTTGNEQSPVMISCGPLPKCVQETVTNLLRENCFCSGRNQKTHQSSKNNSERRYCRLISKWTKLALENLSCAKWGRIYRTSDCHLLLKQRNHNTVHLNYVKDELETTGNFLYVKTDLRCHTRYGHQVC